MFKLKAWLFSKFIFQRKMFFEPTTVFSLLGISLGVAFLVVSMAGFTGFANSLKDSIIHVSGDVTIFKRGSRIRSPEKVEAQIREAFPQVSQVLPFVQQEVLVAREGKLKAVILQGVEWERVQNLEGLKRRRLKSVGRGKKGVGAWAYVGKGVAQGLGLDVGDSFKVILPKVSKGSTRRVTPKVQPFFVHSILEFGRYEFNDRMMIGSLKKVQKLGAMGDGINGFRLKLTDSDLSSQAVEQIQEALGWDYSVRDWSMTSPSLFKAIEYEKMVLFFVMLIMVVAAFFNVSTTLFLGVLKRYAQISVMRALGLKRREVMGLFCLQGLVLGLCGLVLGLGLGQVFCFIFERVQKIYPIMPEEVYRLSHFSTHLEGRDVLWVTGATLLICFLSSLAPAFHGSKLSPVEGLKYE